jgi:hypothetical protein
MKRGGKLHLVDEPKLNRIRIPYILYCLEDVNHG